MMELLPNSMSFRVINSIDLTPDDDIPPRFTGRIRRTFANEQRSVAWHTDGQLDDPGRGVPAYRLYRANGRVKYEMHYSAGLLADPDASTPAVRGFYADGVVHYEERYTDGRRQDGGLGEAAVRKWRADGTLRHELRYHRGVRIPAK
ncbi:MAG: hypothetical protein WEB78_12650 [Ilumatobacteraceae bacterium]